MSIFETYPKSLKHFKELLPIGQRLMLVKAYNWINGELKENKEHKSLNKVRVVKEKRSNDIVLEWVEAGALYYMEWPKADEIEFLIDEHGFYGFSIEPKGYSMLLEYNFV